MNKNEFIELIKGALEAKRGADAKVTKKSVGEFLDDVDTVVELLAGAEGLEVGAKVKLGSYITLEKRAVEAKTGKIVRKVNGELVEQEYTTEAHNAMKAKVSKSLDVK